MSDSIRKLAFILLVVVAVVSGSAFVAGPTWAAEWHVANVGDDTGDGSQARPFKTITKAFAMASANRETDTIYLRRGDTFTDAINNEGPRTYRVELGTKPLPDVVAFRPYGPGEARPVWAPASGTCIATGRCRVTVEGVHFKAGAISAHTPDCVLRDCILDGRPGRNFGRWLRHGAGLTVVDCVINGQTNVELRPNKGLLYHADVPHRGWYRVTNKRAAAPQYQVTFPDGHVYDGDGTHLTFLESGRQTFTFQKRYLSDVEVMKIEPVEALDPVAVVQLDLLNPSRFLRLTEAIKVRLRLGSDRAAKISVVAKRHRDGTVIAQHDLQIAPAILTEKELEFQVTEEGQVDISVQVDGEPAKVAPVKVVMIDTTPLPIPREYTPLGEGTLVDDIDCGADPQATGRVYFASEGTHVVDSALGRYRQAGGLAGQVGHSGGAKNWFAYRLKITHPGKLHRVVVDYPDDDYRSMLLMLYERHRAAYQYDNGIGTGGVRRLSNQIQQREIILWPRFNEIIFAVHSWREGAPAAIQRIRVYEHDGELPALPVGSAERYFGGYYEEPRVTEWSHQPSHEPIEIVNTLGHLGQFMRYSGQNLLWYPTWAYNVQTAETKLISTYDETYNQKKNRLDDRGRKSFRAFLLCGEKYGYSVIAEFHQYLQTMEQLIAEGTPIRDTRQIAWDGRVAEFNTWGGGGYNFVNPAVQQALLAAFRELAEFYKDSPAFMGIAFRGMRVGNPSFVSFNDQYWGYGDVTVGRFERETGIDVPGDENLGDLDRFQKRYDFLMNDVKDEWFAWRARKVTEWLRTLAGMLREVRPDLCVFMNDKGGSYRSAPARGLDPAQWADIPNLRFAIYGWYGPQFAGYYFPTDHSQDIKPWEQAIDRFQYHKSHRAISVMNPYMEGGRLYHLYPPEMLAYFDEVTGSCGAPEGPYPFYKQRFADWMSTGDVWLIADGGLSYQGIDARAKQEFARFFRSLPVAEYKPSPLNVEPVFLWEAEHKGKMLFYVVNRQDYPVELTLRFAGSPTLTRLSDSREFATNGGRLSLSLDPFAMMAFELDRAAEIADGRTKIPGGELRALRERISQAWEIVTAAKGKLADDKYAQALTQQLGRDAYEQALFELASADQALKQRRYDTADRYVRGYISCEAPTKRGHALPIVYRAMNRWPAGVFSDGN